MGCTPLGHCIGFFLKNFFSNIRCYIKGSKWGRKCIFINCTSCNRSPKQIPFQFANGKLPHSCCRGSWAESNNCITVNTLYGICIIHLNHSTMSASQVFCTSREKMLFCNILWHTRACETTTTAVALLYSAPSNKFRYIEKTSFSFSCTTALIGEGNDKVLQKNIKKWSKEYLGTKKYKN